MCKLCGWRHFYCYWVVIATSVDHKLFSVLVLCRFTLDFSFLSSFGFVTNPGQWVVNKSVPSTSEDNPLSWQFAPSTILTTHTPTPIRLIWSVSGGSVQFSSVAHSCPTLCYPMNHSTPGLPVHHQLPEYTQTHSIELVMPSSDLILCRPLLLLPSIFPSIRVFSNESALRITWPKYWSFSFKTSVLPMNTQDWSPLGWTGWISLQSKGLSRIFSNTTVQKHQFFGAQLSL